MQFICRFVKIGYNNCFVDYHNKEKENGYPVIFMPIRHNLEFKDFELRSGVQTKPDDTLSAKGINTNENININTTTSEHTLEALIADTITKDKSTINQIRKEKKRIAEFDRDKKRIKGIKSRKFRRHLKASTRKTMKPINVPDFLIKNIQDEKEAGMFFSHETNKPTNCEDESVTSSSTELSSEIASDNEHLKNFIAEASANTDKNEQNMFYELPGWGQWSHNSAHTDIQSTNEERSNNDEIQKKQRKGFNGSRVIINKGASMNNIKVDLPYGYTKLEYEALLNVPITKESNTLRIFKKFLNSEKKRKEDEQMIDDFEYVSQYENQL